MNFQHSPNSHVRQRSNTTSKTPTTQDLMNSTEYKPKLFDEISILMK
jgi:hypothetical protein